MRYLGDSGRLEDVEVLLVSSSGGKGWVLPKVRAAATKDMAAGSLTTGSWL